MEYSSLTIIITVAILGPTLVMAAVGYASITALGRNPSAAPKILMGLILTLMFSAGVGIIAMLVVLSISIEQ